LRARRASRQRGEKPDSTFPENGPAVPTNRFADKNMHPQDSTVISETNLQQDPVPFDWKWL
jgi:hypothetical protein